MLNINELKKKRFQFLNSIYDETGANKNNTVNIWQIGTKLSFSKEETITIVQYLEGENLIEFASGGEISITHYGIKEIEEALSNPNESTQHFLPLNIIQIQHMENSQIQQSTIESIQKVTFEIGRLEDLKEFIEIITQKLNDLNLNRDDSSEVRTAIQTIEIQLSSSRPKSMIITECLKSIRSIVEGAAGSIAATELLKYLSKIM